jgi:hypothetical protein
MNITLRAHRSLFSVVFQYKICLLGCPEASELRMPMEEPMAMKDFIRPIFR